MRNIKRSAVIGGTTLALVGGGIAFAAWTSTGNGSGTATAISDAGLTVSADDVSGLYPTGSVAVTATVKNNNPYKVALDSIVVGDITSDVAGCDATSVSAPDNEAPGKTLSAAGEPGDSASFPFAVSMSNDAPDECQGAVFTVRFTATGQSSN